MCHIAPPIALLLAKHPCVDNYDLSSLKLVFCAAAPLNESLESELKHRYCWLVGWLVCWLVGWLVGGCLVV